MSLCVCVCSSAKSPSPLRRNTSQTTTLRASFKGARLNRPFVFGGRITLKRTQKFHNTISMKAMKPMKKHWNKICINYNYYT